jgi:hypothetical protein
VRSKGLVLWLVMGERVIQQLATAYSVCSINQTTSKQAWQRKVVRTSVPLACVSSGVGLAGALEAGVEVPRGEFGGDGADLEDELVSVGADPGDGPPAEEGPDADAAEP